MARVEVRVDPDDVEWVVENMLAVLTEYLDDEAQRTAYDEYEDVDEAVIEDALEEYSVKLSGPSGLKRKITSFLEQTVIVAEWEEEEFDD
jgi:phage-related protein